MSSPSSLCVCRWGQGSEGRWKVGEHANFIFNFAPSREIDEEFSGVLVPSSPSDGLGICFAFSVCFMRPFHIYLLLFPSVSRACLLFLPPSPSLRSTSCCYCAWNRAEKLSTECWRGNEIQFDISFNSILCVKWKWILTKASHVSEL